MAEPPRPPSFGEIDLGGEEGESLDLAVESQRKLPAKGGAQPAKGGVPAAKGGIQITPKDKQPPLGEAAKPAAPPARSAPQAAPPPRPRSPAAEAAAARPRPARPPRAAVEEPAEPRRSYAREIKIGLIVLVCLGLVGGGVYGFLKWREGVRLAEEEQLKAIDQGSLDSLKNDALNKGKAGT